jgi:hypothetical protein
VDLHAGGVGQPPLCVERGNRHLAGEHRRHVGIRHL